MSIITNISLLYAASGTYSVTLTVTDNKGATGTSSQSFEVTNSTPDIVLSATQKVIGGSVMITLAWSGASGTMVDIYRNNVLLTVTTNDGSYYDIVKKTKGRSYAYKVCERNSANCSNEVTLTF
jgi:hypothetical protein